MDFKTKVDQLETRIQATARSYRRLRRHAALATAAVMICGIYVYAYNRDFIPGVTFPPWLRDLVKFWAWALVIILSPPAVFCFFAMLGTRSRLFRLKDEKDDYQASAPAFEQNPFASGMGMMVIRNLNNYHATVEKNMRWGMQLTYAAMIGGCLLAGFAYYTSVIRGLSDGEPTPIYVVAGITELIAGTYFLVNQRNRAQMDKYQGSLNQLTLIFILLGMIEKTDAAPEKHKLQRYLFQHLARILQQGDRVVYMDVAPKKPAGTKRVAVPETA